MAKHKTKTKEVTPPEKGDILANSTINSDALFNEIVVKKFIEPKNEDDESNTSNESSLKSEALQNQWEDLCNIYLEEFCKRHNYDYDSDCWVGENPGTVALINDDIFVSMENIRYDVDNLIDIDCFEEWYWKSLEVYDLTQQNYMNYQSFCMGAPDVWTEERLHSIREAKRRVMEAQEALMQEIDKAKEDTKLDNF